jgi:hypothetical protein
VEIGEESQFGVSTLNSTVIRRIPRWGRLPGVAGADRREAPGPKPGNLGPTPQMGFPPLRLRRQPPGSWHLLEWWSSAGRVRQFRAYAPFRGPTLTVQRTVAGSTPHRCVCAHLMHPTTIQLALRPSLRSPCHLGSASRLNSGHAEAQGAVPVVRRDPAAARRPDDAGDVVPAPAAAHPARGL